MNKTVKTISDLLAGQPDRSWNNLGYWHHHDTYTAACHELAFLHGDIINLSDRDTLLDAGCGYGASLGLWQRDFGCTNLYGIDTDSEYVTVAKTYYPEFLRSVARGEFDKPITGQSFPEHWPHRFDAVICIDAAYHARSLKAFLTFIHSAVRDNGRCAFTTLVTVSGQSSSFVDNYLFKLSGIPKASITSLTQMKLLLEKNGFMQLSMVDLTTEVLQGFADFVKKRSKALTLSEKASKAWLKIAMTAWWSERICQQNRYRYVLVAAEKLS